MFENSFQESQKQNIIIENTKFRRGVYFQFKEIGNQEKNVKE